MKVLKFVSWSIGKDKKRYSQLRIKKTILIFRNVQQTDQESEEYENDVRYQNRTEITLDCEEKNVIKGYFI